MTSLPLVDRLRLDKWLWAARLYKTRALAAGEVGLGRVRVNGQDAKPARELKAGDRVEVRQDALWRQFDVRALSPVRGPAPLARELYEETADSVAARTRASQERKLGTEPALTIEHGRPTKRDRREIERSRAGWQRWSVSIDDDTSR